MDNNISIIFKGKNYRLIFTDHAIERMQERLISIKQLINSIEKYDRHFQNYGKEVVEKDENFNTIRTVFSLKTKNIILITTILLGK